MQSPFLNNCQQLPSFQGAIRFQFHRLSVFEVVKQIVSCSHNKAKKTQVCRLTPCREFPRIFSMSRIIYVCVEVLWSFRIWNCFLLLPTHVSPLPLFLKLENRCSVRIPYDTGAIDCFRLTINQVYSVRIPILIHVCIQSHLSVCVFVFADESFPTSDNSCVSIIRPGKGQNLP